MPDNEGRKSVTPLAIGLMLWLQSSAVVLPDFGRQRSQLLGRLEGRGGWF